MRIHSPQVVHTPGGGDAKAANNQNPDPVHYNTNSVVRINGHVNGEVKGKPAQDQKKKVIVGPNDSVGIMMFNTVRERCHVQIFCLISLHRAEEMKLRLVRVLRSKRVPTSIRQLRLSMHPKFKNL